MKITKQQLNIILESVGIQNPYLYTESDTTSDIKNAYMQLLPETREWLNSCPSAQNGIRFKITVPPYSLGNLNSIFTSGLRVAVRTNKINYASDIVKNMPENLLSEDMYDKLLGILENGSLELIISCLKTKRFTNVLHINDEIDYNAFFNNKSSVSGNKLIKLCLDMNVINKTNSLFKLFEFAISANNVELVEVLLTYKEITTSDDFAISRLLKIASDKHYDDLKNVLLTWFKESSKNKK